MINPWKDLSIKPYYVATCDTAILSSPNYNTSEIRFDAMPDPYCGNLDHAEVVFLALNPGFIDDDIDVNLNNKTFISENIKNYQHNASVPFFYLMDELSETGGYKWWKKHLNSLLKEGILFENLQQKIMNIEYMPYHSVRYKHNNIILPSQEYSFNLVRQAIKMNKQIVIMRAKKYWLAAVPELNDYKNVAQLNSTQNVSISRKNMDNQPGAFDRLLKVLK